MRVLPVIAGFAFMLAGCASDAERAEKEANLAKRVQAHASLGSEYMMRNKLDIAQQELELAMDLDKDDSQVNHYMGLLQLRLKNKDKAERYLRRSINLKPDNADAHNSYGVFLCENGKHQDADEQFQAALKIPLYQSPDQANSNAGICKLKTGDRRAAKNYFRSALQSNPNQPAALINLARLSLDDGETLAARGFMQRYLEQAGDSPAALLLAFRIERALGAKEAQANFALKLRGKYPASDEARELRSIAGYR